MIIQRLTLTGADDSTPDLEKFAALQKYYRYIEWGILFAESRHGKPRYPSLEWLGAWGAEGFQRNSSAHLCGRYARQFLHGETPKIITELETLHDPFPRIQINFSGNEAYNLDALKALVLRRLGEGGEVIFQLRAGTIHVVTKLLDAEIPISVLFDESGGRGLEPAAWPQFGSAHSDAIFEMARHVGYAGGFRPGFDFPIQLERLRWNLEGEHTPFFDQRLVSIDMESSLRKTSHIGMGPDAPVRPTDIFDLETCKLAAEGALDWTRYIDIRGLSKPAVLAALFNVAARPGEGKTTAYTITEDEAVKYFTFGRRLSSVDGKQIEVDFDRDIINPEEFDRHNGLFMAENAIKALRERKAKAT